MNRNEKLFSIGEVAKMFHVSVGTLRHYEQAGLLKPEAVDTDTGYRYYSVRQFEILNTIRYLRVLDMPLAQIAEYLNNRDISAIEEKLLHQKELIEQKQRQLAAIERKITHRLKHISDAKNSRLEEISLITVPPCRVVWLRDSLHLESYLDLEYSIRKLEEHQKESLVFLGKVGVGIAKEQLIAKEFTQYSRVFLILDEEDDYNGAVEKMPEETCIAVRFCGSHGQAPVYYEKLLTYAVENGLEIAGDSREITLIDEGMTSNTDEFVTEIRIPVKRR